MSLSTTLLLGFIAGATIVFGLPIGRLRRLAPGLRVFLNATAVGVLLFLFWDGPGRRLGADRRRARRRLRRYRRAGPGFGYGGLYATGLSVGVLGLVGYDR